MTPGQSSKAPSDSIKVVPGRSKLRVESSNPVARGGNPNHRTSKVKLISPEEAIHLSSGVAVSPISEAPSPKKPARATPKAPRPVTARPTPEAPRPVIARPTPEAPRHVPARPTPEEAPRPVPARPTSEEPRPVSARASPEAPRHVSARPTPESPRHVTARATPEEAPRTVPARPTSEEPRPVSARASPEAPKTAPARPTSEALFLAHPAAGFRREIVCGLGAMGLTTLTNTRVRRSNSSHHRQSRTVEPPPSPRASQIRSRVKQRAANATQAVEGAVVEIGDRAKDHGSEEICQSTSVERLVLELLQYLPALHPTWKGRIVDSAMLPEFDCEFWAKPASNISKKAHKLLKAMPTLLKVELLPTGHVLNAVFDRSPRLSDVEMYFFPDEKTTERFKGEHDHLFEAMSSRNAMIKANINGTELLIFSSKQLDRTSQFFINMQYKTGNFLWGFFLQNKDPQALFPGTCYQTDRDLDDGDGVDMDLDTECPTPSLALKMIAETQNSLSRSPVKENNDLRLPPGFEKIWTPLPLVKLNIQGTSSPQSDQTGSAGLVRNESGQWVFGYSRCHQGLSEVAAGLLAIYHGLKYLWDSGYRRIQLETTSHEIIDALTAKTDVFQKRKSILGSCKDLILREWECDIHQISKEENACAEWLASRVEGQPQGLVFYEYPPRGLLDLLEKDRLRAR